MKQEYVQEIKNVVNDIVRDVHTAVPCKIVSYDPEKVEATVQPTAKFRKPDGSLIDYPQIHSVPVYFPQSALQKVTFVYFIKPDDECILLMMEQALDQWRTGAESDTELRFDLQNAICVPGLFSKPNPLAKRAQDNESIIIQREDTFLELYDGMIEAEVKYTENEIDTYHLMVDGREDTLAFTVKNLEDEVTVTANIDGNKGQIDVTATGDINVTTKKNITAIAEKDINIEAARNITIKAEAKLSISSVKTLTITSEESIRLSAPRIDLN